VEIGTDSWRFLRISATRCTLGDVAIPRVPSAAPPPALTARALAESDGAHPAFTQAFVARDRASSLTHAWSGADLALADPAWLAQSGLLDCDPRAIDDDALHALLARANQEDRSAVLTVLLEWAIGARLVPPGALPVLRRIRRAAVTCAATGACETVEGWVARLR
jgi:hypothetical protein